MKYALLFTLLSLLLGYEYTEDNPDEVLYQLSAEAKLDTTEPCGDQPEIIID